MTIYAVENYDSGEMIGFRSVDKARDFIFQYFMENFDKWYNASYYNHMEGISPTALCEKVISDIKDDLCSIMSNSPHINDVLYTHEVPISD